MLFHRRCKCLQLKGSHHTTPTFDRMGFSLVEGIVAVGCRLLHGRKASFGVTQAEKIELLQLWGAHGACEFAIHSLVQNSMMCPGGVLSCTLFPACDGCRECLHRERLEKKCVEFPIG